MIDVWYQKVPTVNGGTRPVVEFHCANDAEARQVLQKLQQARMFDAELQTLIKWPTVDRAQKEIEKTF